MNQFVLLLFLLSGIVTQSFAKETSIMSWNIYYDDKSGVKRYPAIVNAILESKSEVVCLQEASKVFIDQLSQNKAFEEYEIINVKGRGSYKNVILSKNAVKERGVIKLPSNLGRYGVYISTKINGMETMIINLHLDSMMNDTKLRIRQLNKVIDFTEYDDNVVLCGDFNFGDGEPENELVNKFYKDLGLTDKRATYDVNGNSLAKETKFFFEDSRRLDRILIRGNLKARDYKVLTVPYSDHYPIIIQLF